MASEDKRSNASATSIEGRAPAVFVVCIENPGHAASLEARKLYEVLPDADAEQTATPG
jgi:hypothetical protein